jgi:hypothetical protein
MVSCTLSLPIKFVKTLVVVVRTRVKGLEEYVTSKHVPEIIPEIGVGAKVILIDIVTHAFEVFRTPYIILKDKHVAEILGFKHVILAQYVNTTSEQVVIG